MCTFLEWAASWENIHHIVFVPGCVKLLAMYRRDVDKLVYNIAYIFVHTVFVGDLVDFVYYRGYI